MFAIEMVSGMHQIGLARHAEPDVVSALNGRLIQTRTETVAGQRYGRRWVSRELDRRVRWSERHAALAKRWRWRDFRNTRGGRCDGRIGTCEMSYRREDNPAASNSRPEGPAPETLEREKAWRRGESPGRADKVPEFLCSSLVDYVREYAVFIIGPDGVKQLWAYCARLMKWWS